MLEKTKSCAMVLQEKVGEGFLRALFKKSQRKNLTKIKWEGQVAFNVYDTKPVHFFFYGLHWPQMDWKKEKVFDSDAQKNINMSFLRPEVTVMYNNGMNNVDIADQLWGTYWLDRWMRKRKWWWSFGCGGYRFYVLSYMSCIILHTFLSGNQKKETTIALWFQGAVCKSLVRIRLWKWITAKVKVSWASGEHIK
jgi:hypothetical protein